MNKMRKLNEKLFQVFDLRVKKVIRVKNGTFRKAHIKEVDGEVKLNNVNKLPIVLSVRLLY